MYDTLAGGATGTTGKRRDSRRWKRLSRVPDLGFGTGVGVLSWNWSGRDGKAGLEKLLRCDSREVQLILSNVPREEHRSGLAMKR